MADDDFARMLAGYSLTTAEIIYRLPDHPALLQSYVWQDYDLFPEFPQLKGFLDFWVRSLDGPLFKVTVGHCKLIKPAELTPLTTLTLARIAKEAGLPDGVLNVVTGTGPAVGSPLAEHPLVRRIVFTGSVATGRHLAQQLAAVQIAARQIIGVRQHQAPCAVLIVSST